MNEIVINQFEGKSIRTKLDSAGNPWWVAKDVCDVLCIKNNRDAISKLDVDEKASVLLDGSEFSTINESGLYTLILRSNKEEAKKFKKWITSEVLPAIRRTGSYSIEQKKLDPIAFMEAQIVLMKELRDASEKFERTLADVAVIARQDNDTLTHDQISALDEIIHAQYKKHKNGMVAGLIKRRIKEEFFDIVSTRTYKEIPRHGFDRACEIASAFVPPMYLTKKKP
jgi:prophage antirepressor-like protein